MKIHHILSISLCLLQFSLQAQDVSPEQAFLEFWENYDAEFKNPETSPLSSEEMASFDSIPRYEFNSDFRVKAEVIHLKRQKPISFETTRDLKQQYQKVAELRFKIDSVEQKLSAYLNLSLMRNPEYRNRWFVPFTDASNGFGTYEGGRYLEVEGTEENEVILDFNLAYNPYCLYNKKYSCPIPPRENDLKTAIEAGARSE
jgi:hypothetical protein